MQAARQAAKVASITLKNAQGKQAVEKAVRNKASTEAALTKQQTYTRQAAQQFLSKWMALANKKAKKEVAEKMEK